jgi:hypothetical protein
MDKRLIASLEGHLKRRNVAFKTLKSRFDGLGLDVTDIVLFNRRKQQKFVLKSMTIQKITQFSIMLRPASVIVFDTRNRNVFLRKAKIFIDKNYKRF